MENDTDQPSALPLGVVLQGESDTESLILQDQSDMSDVHHEEQESETSNPSENETSNPSENETSNPPENESSNPSENETSNPFENETINPSENENSNPSENETSNPSENETSNSSENETSNPSENETNNRFEFSIPQDQRDRLEDIRRDGNDSEASNTELSADLDENKKRWIIIGICIHSLVSPILRKYIESKIAGLYQTLIASHSLDTQKYPSHYQPSGVRLFYDNINNNLRQHGRQFRNYDMRILNQVDLAKIHLPSSLAKFNAFDETCDSSALLSLLNNPCLPVFSAALRSSSQRMLTNVRNDWAHCNFDRWNFHKYQEAFDIIETLIRDLGLASLEENRTLGELDKWAKNGHDFLSGTTLGLELVNEIKNQTSAMADYVLTLTSESETTIARLQVELNGVKIDLCSKITAVEKARLEFVTACYLCFEISMAFYL